MAAFPRALSAWQPALGKQAAHRTFRSGPSRLPILPPTNAALRQAYARLSHLGA